MIIKSPRRIAGRLSRAKFLAPENLSRIGMTYESIEYQGKRLNESSFKELRAKNPGAIVVGEPVDPVAAPRIGQIEATLYKQGLVQLDQLPPRDPDSLVDRPRVTRSQARREDSRSVPRSGP